MKPTRNPCWMSEEENGNSQDTCREVITALLNKAIDDEGDKRTCETEKELQTAGLLTAEGRQEAAAYCKTELDGVKWSVISFPLEVTRHVI